MSLNLKSYVKKKFIILGVIALNFTATNLCLQLINSLCKIAKNSFGKYIFPKRRVGNPYLSNGLMSLWL